MADGCNRRGSGRLFNLLWAAKTDPKRTPTYCSKVKEISFTPSFRKNDGRYFSLVVELKINLLLTRMSNQSGFLEVGNKLIGNFVIPVEFCLRKFIHKKF
jgi:hypothetical protein